MSQQQPVVTAARTPSKNLLQQLPAGAVLAFQALAATFTNQGNCYPSNKWLTVGLVTVLSATCIFFSFTDSIVFQGKVYYGVAMPNRLNILNMSKAEEEVFFEGLDPELKKRGLKTVDWVHAFLSLVVFLIIAGSDVGLQNCFFPTATDDTRQWLRNLPLGIAVMTSFLFMIFPTTRKGIRLDNSSPPPDAATAQDNKKDDNKPEADNNDGAKPAAAAAATADKAIMSTASLLERLPTGPVLAFQTLAASFTNQGKCYHSNFWLSVGLVTFLGATCVFSSFTDCMPDPNTGKIHKGVALPGTLHIIGMSKDNQNKMFGKSELEKRGLKTMDWVHAFFTAVVFLTIAGSDVGLQNCFFPAATDDTRQLLKNLPLGIAVLSSFVFIVFPTTRKGMGFDDSDYIVIATDDDDDTEAGKKETTNKHSTEQDIHETQDPLLPPKDDHATEHTAILPTREQDIHPAEP